VKPTSGKIRQLTPGDVRLALQMSSNCGWNQTADDWHLLLDLAPEGSLCIEIDGVVAATTTLLPYGDRLGWIGMVLTHPDFRRRGFATRLLTLAIERADQVGIRTLKLDATEQGQPLYSSLGFRAEQSVERWFHPAMKSAKQAPNTGAADLSSWFARDTSAFGADRSKLLPRLALRGGCVTSAGGYVLTRPGNRTAYLGPGVATTPVSARELFGRSIQVPAATGWSWDLFPENRNAVALATELGFAPQRRLMRMVRGEELRGKDEFVYAIAGFELG